MPAPLPPTGNLVLSLIGARVRLVIPGVAVVGLAALVLVPAQLSEHHLPMPAPVPQVPLQASSVGAVPQVIASVVQGGLPPPGPNQKRSGQCDGDQGQEEVNGGCWVPVANKPPPCPRGKLWEHEGKCWTPVAVLPRVPTSGDLRPAPVAEP